MSGPGAPAARDAAWVVLETRLPPEELAGFCACLDSLYRINPFLEIHSWQQPSADVFRAAFRNHSNAKDVVLEGRVTHESGLCWRVDFATGLKSCTRFRIEPLEAGSRLTITDEYRPVPDGADAGEVDRSLHAWGVALKEFLERERRWGWLPLYRAFMQRLWLPMKPAARRVAFLILVVGLADLVLAALGLAIYWLEALR